MTGSDIGILVAGCQGTSNAKCKEQERVKIVYFQGMQAQWKSRRDFYFSFFPGTFQDFLSFLKNHVINCYAFHSI